MGTDSVTDLFAGQPNACPACDRIGSPRDDGERECTNDCRVIRYEEGDDE